MKETNPQPPNCSSHCGIRLSDLKGTVVHIFTNNIRNIFVLELVLQRKKNSLETNLQI